MEVGHGGDETEEGETNTEVHLFKIFFFKDVAPGYILQSCVLAVPVLRLAFYFLNVSMFTSSNWLLVLCITDVK